MLSWLNDLFVIENLHHFGSPFECEPWDSIHGKDESGELKINRELSAIYRDLAKLDPDNETPTSAPAYAIEKAPPGQVADKSLKQTDESVLQRFRKVQDKRIENKRRLQSILANPAIKKPSLIERDRLTDPIQREDVGDFVRKTEDQKIREHLDPREPQEGQ